MRTFAVLAVVSAALLATTGSAADPNPPPSTETPKYPDKIAGHNCDWWVKATQSVDPSLRERAVRVLPYFGEPARATTIPALMERMENDPDSSIRTNALVSLGVLGAGPNQVKTVVDRLRDRAVSDSQVLVRYLAIRALARHGSQARAAIPELRSLTGDTKSWEIRKAAVVALGVTGADPKLGPDMNAMHTLLDVLQREYVPEIRMEAAIAIIRLGRPAVDKDVGGVLSVLKQRLGLEPEKHVVLWLHMALLTVEGIKEEGLKEIAQYLQDKDPIIRSQAAMVLSALGEKSKPRIPDLINTLTDKEPLVVYSVIMALAVVGKDDKPTLAALTVLKESKESSEFIKDVASRAIDHLLGKEPQKNKTSAVEVPQQPRPEPGSTEKTKITEIGGRKLDDWIKDTRNMKDPSVRQRAVRTLPYFGDENRDTYVPAITERIDPHNEPDASVRCNAVIALGTSRATEKTYKKAVEVLANSLAHDEQTVIRYHAACALARFGYGGRDAIPQLLEARHLKQSWEIRKSAVYALGTMGVDKNGALPQVVTELEQALVESCSEVRLEAIIALNDLGKPPMTNDRATLKATLQARMQTETNHQVQVWLHVALMNQDQVTPKGLEKVASYLKDVDPEAREQAATALGTLRKEAKPQLHALIAALNEKDQEPQVQLAVMIAMANVGGETAVEALKAFKDRKETPELLKKSAEYVLNWMGEKKAK